MAKLTDFITVPRRIFRMLEGGEITETEFMTYITLRHVADIKGIAHVQSLNWLSNRMPRKYRVKGNTLGKSLKSLLILGEIAYDLKRGIRSGFKIKLMDWPLGNGKIRAKQVTEEQEITTELTSPRQVSGDVSHKSDHINHNSNPLKKPEYSSQYSKPIGDIIGSRYNDRNKEIPVVNNKECILTESYIPGSYDQERLHYFAKMCRDLCMNFYLGKYKQHQHKAIEAMSRAEVKYKEADFSKIENRPAFFNSLVGAELGEVLNKT